MKSTFLLLITFLGSLQLWAQQDTISKKTTLTAAIVYNSDVSYYGQSTNEEMPYILLNATLRLPAGVYFSAGSYKLFNYGSGISAADLGLGFDYDINDQLSFGLGYSRSFFPSNSPLLQASNENNLNFSATYTSLFFKTDLNADYAFGQQSDVFLSLDTSREVILGNFFSDKNEFYIEPAIEIVAGSRSFYQTYTIAKGKRDKEKGKGLKSPGNSGNSGNSGKSGSSAAESTITRESRDFNLLSYNFKLPLSLSRANYITELSYQFSVLGRKAEEELKKQQSYFGLAFYYQF
ncbi:MipA/OmpV family protein [Desertivirga xinjiangensis]|uniref:MipA/OmpV family protein n=1 Tax=Desertivirga xinjiangensis TaxID=539206 RepID=UPI00210E0619|nr:MipA/OmpV family protein [Pedobacter xinjiangensis]